VRQDYLTPGNGHSDLWATLSDQEVNLDELVERLYLIGWLGLSDRDHALPDSTTFLGAFAIQLDGHFRLPRHCIERYSAHEGKNLLAARLTLANFAAQIASPATPDGGGMPAVRAVIQAAADTAARSVPNSPWAGPILAATGLSSVEQCREAADLVDSYRAQWRKQCFPSDTTGQPASPAVKLVDLMLGKVYQATRCLGGDHCDACRYAKDEPEQALAGAYTAGAVDLLAACAGEWATEVSALTLEVYSAASGGGQVQAALAGIRTV
jgi:hypothetical protein